MELLGLSTIAGVAPKIPENEKATNLTYSLDMIKIQSKQVVKKQ